MRSRTTEIEIMKQNQASALDLLFKKEKLATKLNPKGILVVQNSRNLEVEFKHQDPYQHIRFLWSKIKNKPVTVFESYKHKVVVSGYSEHGEPKFTMEMHVKANTCYTEVENILPVNSVVSKTKMAHFPAAVAQTMRTEWFQELKKMLMQFNEQNQFA